MTAAPMFSALVRPLGRSSVRGWLWPLVIVDLGLVAIFLALRFLQGVDVVAVLPPLFDIFNDTGLPERFNHLKWAGISGLMLALYVRTKVPAFLALALLFAAVLADDALRLHESGSAALATVWPDMPRLGMTAAEAGEVATWLAFGLVLVPVMLRGIWMTPREWWPVVLRPVAGFAGVLFFAIGVDVAQQPLWHQDNPAVLYWGKLVMGLIEDTGEAVFGSITLCLSADIWLRHGQNNRHPAE